MMEEHPRLHTTAYTANYMLYLDVVLGLRVCVFHRSTLGRFVYVPRLGTMVMTVAYVKNTLLQGTVVPLGN
jgi:hypothetical protein